MEEPSSGGASPSRESNNSIDPETTNPSIASSLDGRFAGATSKCSLGSTRTPPTKKAKRVRFFRNGDKFYTGVVMAVTPERYRSFDSLASDLTRALGSSVTLPNGVRSIYTMDGRKVQTIGDLEDGKCYVVSGQGEMFKKVEYSASKVRKGSSLSGLPQSPAGTGRQISSIPACVRARIVTLVRNGSKPRKVVRLLLNKRNSPSIEHVFEAITEAVKLDSGAVRRVYTIAGKPVISLEQFFEMDEIFVAYGTEKSSQEDFDLDGEESKSVQSFRRGPWISKRQSGPMPVMPRKSGKRALTAPAVRTPSPSALILPQPLRFQYAVGHVIGDGNFAVVRHCIHKSTGAEYAMKIVDKYKCQGKETMLASEVAILRQVCHPNIISLIGEQETVDQLFLVMELVKGGDLFDAIAAATKFSEAEASVMISHLTSALAYLHSHQIVHRDVKPENLLVEMEGSQVRCLKLGDFGLAQVVHEPLYTVCGTPTYVAPEILAESGYGLKIDVWAAGVILYILLCGFPPFVSPENDQEELFERILSGQYEFTVPYWDPVSDTAKQLISNMLQAQPELRFSAEDVLDHPWLVSFLGGEQTLSGGGAAVKSPKQHRDQQCQPLRLATFEFDYKKQRRLDDVGARDNETASDSNDLGTRGDARNQWLEASVTVNEAFRRSNVKDTRQIDLTDNANGNRNNDDEPLSLSADCLRDIRDLTSSLHDLVINIDDCRDNNATRRKFHDKTISRDIPASSMAITMENRDILMKNDVNSKKRAKSPLSFDKKHSVNQRNGNSLLDIHSSSLNEITTCHDDAIISNEPNCDTPKTGKRPIDRIARAKRTNFCKFDDFGTNDIRDNSRSSNDELSRESRNLSIDRSSRSTTDAMSESSDNNIETSDSFVNIQFAKEARRDNESISSQSVQSSDSFENTSFSRVNDETGRCDKGIEDVVIRREIGRATVSRKIDCSERRRSIGTSNNRQTRQSINCHSTKAPKPSMIPVQSNGQTRNFVNNVVELSRVPLNDVVKLREKKNIAVARSAACQSKNDARTKRFSCFSQYSARLNDNLRNETKPTSGSSIVNGRKCSSTDELREEQERPIEARTKRFSLYYTPQPARKIYETETKGTITPSRIPGHAGSRPTSWKTPEPSRKINEQISRVCEHKDSSKNRKSVVESTTAASRNKSNRQAVHTRNSNLPPGRTK